MALSNSVKTMIIDPTVFNNSRCEFRLAPGYLSNLKLVDVGVYSTNIVDRSTGVFYPSIMGCLAAIKKISLFSGATMIDEIQELPSYGAVQHLKTTNQAQEDLNRFELLNGCSFAIKSNDAPLDTQQSVGALTTESQHKDYVKTYLENGGLFKNYHNNQVQVANTDAGAASGVLVLSSYLQFLATVPVLPNIPDLRLVLEFNLAAGDYYVDADASSAVSPTFLPIRPQLMYEELLGVKAEANVDVPYQSTIVERFVVPAAADGTTVQTSFRSGAFRNRYVNDLVLFNKVSTTDGWLRAKERSVAQKNETIQLIVNAKKYLPDQGINQESMKLAYFHDSQGGLNIPLAAAMSSCWDAANGTNRLFDSQTAPLAHNMSVTGVLVQDVIDRLDIEYSRTGSTVEADQTTAFDLLVFGKVNRRMQIQNGVVRLSY